MPQPFTQERVDRLRRLTETYGVMQAARIAKVTANGIRNIRKRGWTAGRTGRWREMPSDFRIQAAHMTVGELCAHYRAWHGAVARWSKEIGREPSRRGRPKGSRS